MDTPDAAPVPLAEAARRLGVSVESLRKRCQRGSVQATHLDGRWHVYLDTDGTPRPSRTPVAAYPSSPSTDLATVLAALSRLEQQQAAILARLDQLAAGRAVVAQEALDAPALSGDTREAARRPWWRFW